MSVSTTKTSADVAASARPEASAPTATVRASRRSARKTRSAAGKAVLVVLLLGFTLFPAFWMLSSAFDAQAGTGGQQILPREWTLANFEYVLTEGGFDVFLRNSAIVAIVTVLASALLALLASVAVARFRFRFRTAMLMMILVVQMVPLEALVIPLFVQVRDLQLLNTLLGGATENYTVAIGLKQFFGEHSNEWGYIMAASTIITIPVMIFFVIVQRRLSSGLVSGAVKG